MTTAAGYSYETQVNTMIQHTHHYYINATLYDSFCIPDEIKQLVENTNCQEVTAADMSDDHYVKFPEHAKPDEWKLPVWAARSSLFSIIEKQHINSEANFRTTLQELHLREMPKILIYVWGWKLSLYDRLVWMECLSQLQGVPSGQPAKIKWRSTLKALGQTFGKNPIAGLKGALYRLSNCAIAYLKATAPGGTFDSVYITQLLDYNEANQTIAIPPALLLLLSQQHAQRNREGAGSTDPTKLHHLAVKREDHLKLKTGLGRWLHTWYLSHDKWWPVTYEFLKAKTEIQIEETYHQLQALQRAVEDLNQLSDFGMFALIKEQKQEAMIVGKPVQVVTRESSSIKEAPPRGGGGRFQARILEQVREKQAQQSAGLDWGWKNREEAGCAD